MIGLAILDVSNGILAVMSAPMTNQVAPKKLLNSKWTKMEVVNKEKHFIITEVEFDEMQKVTLCVTQSVITKNEYSIDWRDLKNPQQWRLGWQ